jgi:hypothetical protein
MWTVVHCNVCLCNKNLINSIYFETLLQRILKLKSVAKGENVTVAFRAFVIFSTSIKITHNNLFITLKFSQDT